MPGSIPEVGDPKLGATVKFGVSGWQNLYLEHIGSDRRICSEEVDLKRSLTHHRGPSETHFQKSSWARDILIRGAFGVLSAVIIDESRWDSPTPYLSITGLPPLTGEPSAGVI